MRSQVVGGEGEATAGMGRCGHGPETPGGLQERSAPTATNQPDAAQPARCQKALTPSSLCITQPTSDGQHALAWADLNVSGHKHVHGF